MILEVRGSDVEVLQEMAEFFIKIQELCKFESHTTGVSLLTTWVAPYKRLISHVAGVGLLRLVSLIFTYYSAAALCAAIGLSLM
jgi:hypothetical protein